MKLLLFTLTTLTSLAYANLPDEINYPPYEEEYDRVSSELRSTEQDLSNNQSARDNAIEEQNQNHADIASFNEAIANLQFEIQRLQRSIPNMNDQITEHHQLIRDLDNQIYNLGQRIQRLTEKIKQGESQITNLGYKISAQKRSLRTQRQKRKEITNKITPLVQKTKQLRDQNKNLKTQIANLQQKVQELQVSKKQKEAKLAQLKQDLPNTQSLLTSNKEEITILKTEVSSLQSKLQKLQAQLKKLIASGAPKDQIAKKQEQITKVQGRIKQKQNQISRKKTLIAKLEKKLQNTKNNIFKLQSEISSIPNKIANNQKKIKDKKSSLQYNKSLISRNDSSIARLKSDREKVQVVIDQVKQNIARFNTQEQSLITTVEELKTNRRDKKAKRDRKQERRSATLTRIRELEGQIRHAQRTIPKLQQEVRNSRVSIQELQDRNRELTREELRLDQRITRLSEEVSRLTDLKYDAYHEYDKRRELYNQYFEQAQEIGKSQTDPAIKLGEKKGSSLAKKVAQKTGLDIGQKLGTINAKLAGFIRGELTGYEDGYQAGITNQATIAQANSQALQDSEKNATNHAQSVLKPKYFEAFLQEAFNEEVEIQSHQKKMDFAHAEAFSLKSIGEFKFQAQTIPLVSTQERADATALQTIMDAQILSAQKEEGQVQQLFSQYQRALTVYEAPQSIPYQTVKCTSVYKNIKDFIDACKKSYTTNFKRKYRKASKDTFSAEYPGIFKQTYTAKELQVRNQKFQALYQQSYDKVFVYAESIGKKDVHNQTYAETYKIQYPIFLNEQSNIAEAQAQTELVNWLAVNPSITIVKSEIFPKVLKGGDSGTIQITLKNIGHVKSNSPGVIRIDLAAHMKVAKKEVLLPTIEARSLKTISIPFTVNENAGSSDKLSFQAQISLPGDKYRNLRSEMTKTSLQLSLNPKMQKTVDYNRTPKVKGFRKYYIHTASVKITPQVENISAGYKATIKVQDQFKSYVSIKNAEQATGSIAKGQTKELKLTYVFTKRARKRQISFVVKISYKGQTLSEEIITMTPR